MAKTETFLFWYSSEHSTFRNAELEALFQMFNLDPETLQSKRDYGPFMLMDFPSDIGPRELMSRSVLLHSCYKLWVCEDSLEKLHSSMKEELHLLDPYINSSFRVLVDTYGNTTMQSKKVELIETFSYMPLEGRVDLKNADLSLHLLLYYGLDTNNKPEEPVKLFFGPWISDGQRHLISRISLKDRKFIGNTSMDPLLSLLMANLAQVKFGDFVLDPFVGTGSLLVAAAMFGGFVCGTDIDFLMLHGRTRPSRSTDVSRSEDESVRSNLKQYCVESQYLDVLVADSSRPDLFREDIRFDSIITDPPYGVRESTERIGTTKGYNKIAEEYLELHVPSKVDYSLTDILCDLLNFSVNRLNVGGRLVFWIPINRPHYDEKKLPHHPCLKMISNCEQALTTFASRRLLVLQKVSEPLPNFATQMDGSILMHRLRLLKPKENTRTRKEKKQLSAAFGGGSKRGHQT